jgi:hypothetical protein
LLEDVKLGVELQNAGLTVVEELGLEPDPRLTSGLYRFPDDLVKFGGEGVEDPHHHNVVQPSPIGGRIDNIREDMVVKSVAVKRESTRS